VKLGVQDSVPEVFAAFFVNTAPAVMAVPVAVRLVMASPSGSTADTVKVISVFSAPEAVAGAVTTGARSTLVTVTVVDAEPLRAFEAVNVTL
jgi:glucosamine 6-phosphate synthetase-like amidotransferase/phosphosugar isomerase protein